MKCFLIPDSLFLRSNTDSCGSGLKRFNAFEIHGDCWELHGNCSLLWSSCWAEAVHPPPGIAAVPAATTQGPRAGFIITSGWRPRDCHGQVRSSSCRSGKGHHTQVQSSLQQQHSTAGRWWRREKRKCPSLWCSKVINSTARITQNCCAKPGWGSLHLSEPGLKWSVWYGCLTLSFKVSFALGKAGHKLLWNETIRSHSTVLWHYCSPVEVTRLELQGQVNCSVSRARSHTALVTTFSCPPLSPSPGPPLVVFMRIQRASGS